MRITLAFFCLVLFASKSYAQSVEHKNEVGFNVQSLIGSLLGSDQPPFEFMYKKSISPSANYLRLGLRGSFNFQENPYEPDDYFSQGGDDYSNSSLNLGLILGYEKRLTIADSKWWVNFGADVIPEYRSFTRNQFDYDYLSQGEESITRIEERSKELGATIRPFLGLAFDINSRLYLATEASFNGQLLYGQRESENFVNGTLEPGSYIERDYKRGNVFFKPATSLFVYYKF